MTRVAALDCGTNSLRLLVADLDGQGGLVDVHREMRVVRLGEGVDRTGRLSREALERTGAALRDYAAVLADLGAQRVRLVATSATRDAANRDAFTALVGDTLGVAPDVVAGSEEAALSFAGATAALSADEGPFLVVDVGGGSTELVLGAVPGGAVQASHSADVGCVRLTERHLLGDPPTPAQVAAARADVALALGVALVDVPVARAATVLWLAGSATTAAAHLLHLPAYDAGVLHGSRHDPADFLAACQDLLAMPRAARAALPYMHPGRVDVIGGGALVLAAVAEAVLAARAAGPPAFVVSETDILDGIALSLGEPSPTDPTDLSTTSWGQ